MSEHVLPSDMDPAQRIDELHAWIATHADGGQGIIACILPGLGSTPMVSARRHVMEGARPLVLAAVRRTSGRGGDEVVRVELATFRRVDRYTRDGGGDGPTFHAPDWNKP